MHQAHSPRTGKGWRNALLTGLVLCGMIPALALTPSEKKTIRKALTAKVKSLGEEGTEARVPRILVEEFFSNPKKRDVFAFLALAPKEGEEAPATYLFLLSDDGKRFAVVASSKVGDAVQPVEAGFVKVQGPDVFLRSGEASDASNQSAYGEDKVYFRWRLEDDRLTRVGDVWLRRGTQFEAFKPR